MTLVVPFDGTDLSEAALVRAEEFRDALSEDVLAVSVIPRGNASYARERDWIEPNEPFDLETVVSVLRERVEDRCPEAGFEYEVVDRYAPTGQIAARIRKAATNAGATMVFVGSANVGTVATSVSSVGSGVASDRAYDVVIVRSHRAIESR